MAELTEVPRWLQELRDLLGLEPYEARQTALQVWQDRWLTSVTRQWIDEQDNHQMVREAEEARQRSRLGDLLVKTFAHRIIVGRSTYAGNPIVELRVIGLRDTPQEARGFTAR